MFKGKRMLLLADWHGAASGYSTVVKNILPTIANQFDEVLFVAINYYGEPYQDGNITVVSAKNFFKPNGEEDAFGRHSFLSLLANDVKGFDLCFFIQDIEIVALTIPTMREQKLLKQKANVRSFKTAIYFPVDAVIPKGYIDEFKFFDLLITFNQYAKNEVVKVMPELKNKVKIIPHGNNSKDFYVMPAEETLKFRREYFGTNADKIIVSSVNRNQPRKNISDTILSFIEARKLAPTIDGRKLFLYLHMMRRDVFMSGWDLDKLFSQTDLVEGEEYMIANQDFFEKAMGADISILRGIYNASDVFVTNTLGEGWGLSITEAMACMCPVVAPNHTSIAEIGDNGNRIYALFELDPFCNSFDSTIRFRANIEECGEAIVKAATNRISDKDTAMLEAANKYVLSLKWENIGKMFIDRFSEILK